MKVPIKKYIFFVLSRGVWLYLLFGVAVFYSSIPNKALSNHLNQLKGVEKYLKDFEGGGELPETAVLEEGVRYYELLSQHIKDSVVYGNKGFCHFYLGNYSQSLEAYKKAIEMEPEFYGFHWDLGLMNFYLGDFKKAQYFFDRALFQMPGAIKYYDHLRTELVKEENDKAHQYLLACYYRVHQDREEAFIKLAQCYRFLHQPKEMLQVSLSGLKQYPKSQKLYYFSGLARFLLNDHNGAIKDFNKALSLDSNDANAYYYRGLCFQKTGEKLAGMIDFSKVANIGDENKTDQEKFLEMKRMHLNTELIILRYFM